VQGSYQLTSQSQVKDDPLLLLHFILGSLLLAANPALLMNEMLKGFLPGEALCCGKLVITTEVSGSDKYQQGVSVVRGGMSESMMGATASVLQSQI
jgi:hypothetical protein